MSLCVCAVRRVYCVRVAVGVSRFNIKAAPRFGLPQLSSLYLSLSLSLPRTDDDGDKMLKSLTSRTVRAQSGEFLLRAASAS